MLSGERTVEAYKNMYFEDVTNNVKAVIAFSTFETKGLLKKKSKGVRDEFYGMIYQCKPFGQRATTKDLFARFPTDKVKDFSKYKDKDRVKDLCKIEGSYLRNLVIGGKKYWDMDRDRPVRMVPERETFLDSRLQSALPTLAEGSTTMD